MNVRPQAKTQSTIAEPIFTRDPKSRAREKPVGATIMIEIDEMYVEILNEIGCDEPWHIISASFYEDFLNPRELPERLMLLRNNGLITIDPVATVDSLYEDAEKNDWYKSTVWPEKGPVWYLKVTEKGFAVLKQHGREWVKSEPK